MFSGSPIRKIKYTDAFTVKRRQTIIKEHIIILKRRGCPDMRENEKCLQEQTEFRYVYRHIETAPLLQL